VVVHPIPCDRRDDAGGVDLAYQPGVLKIDPIDNANGSRGDEVTGDHAHGRVGHGRVWQPLTERRLDFVAQLASSLLCTVQRYLVGDAHTVGIFASVSLGLELFVHLGPEAMHQHNLDTHALNHGQVLRQMRQFPRRNCFSCNADHEGLVAKFVDVGCDRAKPGHEGEVENGGHGAQGGRTSE